jgi:putative ABC transport system permease protein
LTRKPRLDRELDDEVLAHLELAEKELIASGLPPSEARNAARRNFGGVEQMKEEHRDDRSYPWIEGTVRDIRYALASLARRPGFAAITISVLALGIGANSAMFSLIDAVLWKPLPFPSPERMVRVDEGPGGRLRNHATTTLTFLDWKRQDSLFEALSVEAPTAAALTTDGEPIRLEGVLVSADYFNVYGVHAQIGRTFTSKEDQPGAAPVVVISHAMWKTRFGSDPEILTRDLVLDGEPNRIVGVLPTGTFDREAAVYWKPLIFAPEQMTRGDHWLQVVGRLRQGVSLEQAQAKLTALRATLANEMPAFKKDWIFAIDPYTQELVGNNLRQSIYLGFGAVLLVLLIACANVANLILTRGAARQKEMALRAALGASRGRLMMQLLVESWVLCLLGGAAGIAIAYAMVEAAAPFLAPYLPFTADLRVDFRVLAFAAAAAMTVSILIGLLPSLQTSFGHLTETLNQSARGSSGSSAMLRRAIVIGEVAVSLILVCGAALLLKSLNNLQNVDAGVRIDRVITMTADLPLAAYPKGQNATLFYRAAVDHLQSVPGVERVALAQDLPLQGVRGGELFILPGVAEPVVTRFKRVDPNYFAAFDIPVISGRGIQESDRAGSPRVFVINQKLAQLLASKYGIADPIGKLIQVSVPGYGKDGGTMQSLQIVGVIRDERTTGDLQAQQDLVVYAPLAQVPRPDIRIIVRTRSEPLGIISGIREAMRQADRNLPLSDVRTMEQVKERNLVWAKQPTWVIAAFAAVATLLAALGLYGVLSHAVLQQRREIGIRMALGASSSDVVSHVLRNALGMILIGLVLGMAGAIALTRVMKSLLYEVSPLDPFALAAACAVMIVIGLLAGFLPANRASRVDPVTTLRAEG